MARKNTSGVRAAAATFLRDPESWDPLAAGPLTELLESRPDNHMLEVDHEFPKVGRKVLPLNAGRLVHDRALPNMVLVAMEDVTEKFSE